MTVKEFVEKAKRQDARNVFQENCKSIENLPENLKSLYMEANPIDVEVLMDGKLIHFYPMDELNALQTDYNLPMGRFVFATCNSDPIYTFEGRIYNCYHGTSIIKDELMANSLDKFLDMID